MWIEETKDGKFKFVERYEDYLTGKQKKVSITMEKNTAQARKMAQASLNAKIEQRRENSPSTNKNLTLRELVEAYKKYQKRELKASTYSDICYSTRSTLRIFGADTLVSRISAKYIKDALTLIPESNSTLNNYLKRLKTILKWGYKNDYIDDISYLAKIDFFKEESKKVTEYGPITEDKYMESSELQLLLANIKLSKWRDLTEFLALTGLRIGEALALTIKDVDLKKRIISVTKTYDMRNRIVDTPKTDSSYRCIYIQDELLSLCSRIKKESTTRCFMTGCKNFFQNDGRMYSYYAYNDYLKRHTLKILGRQLTPHALRHTHATLLLEQGVSIEVISRRLGHESVAITEKIYLHITQKLKERDYADVSKVAIL